MISVRLSSSLNYSKGKFHKISSDMKNSFNQSFLYPKKHDENNIAYIGNSTNLFRKNSSINQYKLSKNFLPNFEYKCTKKSLDTSEISNYVYQPKQLKTFLTIGSENSLKVNSKNTTLIKNSPDSTFVLPAKLT